MIYLFLGFLLSAITYKLYFALQVHWRYRQRLKEKESQDQMKKEAEEYIKRFIDSKGGSVFIQDCLDRNWLAGTIYADKKYYGSSTYYDMPESKKCSDAPAN